MVKHTQTIRRQKPTNCLNVFDHFVELTLKGITKKNGKNTFDFLGGKNRKLLIKNRLLIFDY